MDHSIGGLSAPPPKLLELNAENVKELCGANYGVTLQFVADQSKLDAAYENGQSLLWRDAGALSATIALVATALGAVATPLGRVGDVYLKPAGISASRFQGVGAVHLSANS